MIYLIDCIRVFLIIMHLYALHVRTCNSYFFKGDDKIAYVTYKASFQHIVQQPNSSTTT